MKEEIKQESDSLADTIRRLAAGCENTIGDFKVKKEVTIGEPRNGRYDGKKMKVTGGLWFNNGDSFSHVREYKRWKTALKELALENHAVEIMRAGLCKEKEPNPLKHFRLWDGGDELATNYTTCS